jgi:site-specific DNA-methyltransferase (adenine-specific)
MDENTRKVMFSSHSDEYETPIALYRVLDDLFHFTLDPAASDLSFMHPNYYTIAEDGLAQDWLGEVCFINPPYSQAKLWISKIADEFLNNETECVLLAPARTETRYWHENIWPIAHYILFLKRRLKFINKTLPSYSAGGKPSSAPYPSAVIMYTHLEFDESVADELNKIGYLVNLWKI